LSDTEQALIDILVLEDAAQGTRTLRRVLREGELSRWLDVAREHGLSPWLYHRLREWPEVQALPGWAQLQSDYWQVAAANTLRYHQLDEVLQALCEADLRVAVLKGGALAELLYDSVALRTMGDIDLLLPKSQMPQATALLRDLGYRRHDPEPEAGFGLEYENEIAWVHPDRELVLELHWHLIDAAFYLQRVPEAALWAEMVPLEIGDHAVETFNAEATLVYLAGHWVLHHRLHGLRWLLDLDQLVRRGGLNWDRVGQVAADWYLVRPLQKALAACRRVADTPIPEATWATLQALTPTAAERRVYAYLTAPQRDVISRFYRELVMIEGWRRRWRYLIHNIFPTRTYMLDRYDIPPGRPIWPYHLYRFLDGLRRLAAKAWPFSP
jgi:hypothetical protein